MQVFVSGRGRGVGETPPQQACSPAESTAHSASTAPSLLDEEAPPRSGLPRQEARAVSAHGSPGTDRSSPGRATFSRDLRLDFFRGLALIFIFIDHIADNVLSFFTVQSVQFFDAAEVFIFISGYTAAMVYGRTLSRHGPFYAGAQILRRAWQLYIAHIFLFVMFVAEVSYTVTTFNNPMYNDEMQIGEFLTEPHIAIVKALLLQFQPTYLDILPLYIVLLVVFPLVLVGLKLRPMAVIAASFVLYLLVQVDGISVPAYPPGHDWYFNPLAWQFLFVAGAALGLDGGWGSRLIPRKRLLLAVGAVIVGAAFVIRLSWTLHSISDSFPGLFLAYIWPVDKSDLAPIRLVSFFAAAAIIAALVPPGARFLRTRVARPFVLCGRHSLEIFCLGILLSALGHFVLSEYDSSVPSQLAVNIVGILTLCLTAKLIDWYRNMGRTSFAQPTASSAWGEQ
jgi:hypothetical protein